MMMFRHKTEATQFKRSIDKFYKRIIKPRLLSIKHFFKSSIVFFKRHPRFRTVSIICAIFLTLIVVSNVFGTFAKRGINQNFMNGEVSEVETPFWYKLFMEDDPNYNQKVELDYISWDGTVPTWDATNLDANFDGGDGSEANPYIIASPRALLNFRSAENYTTFNKNNRRYYLVTENIDLGGINIGSASDELFSGVIDGNYKHIKGLKIDTDESGRGDISLLGRIGDGDKPVVKNFIIDDVEINTSGTANYYVGALVSYVGSKAVVYNSGVLSGTITIGEMNTSKKNYIGSLVGFIADKNNNNAVANCYSYVNINSDNTLGNNTKIGGVVGYRDRDSENMNDRNSVVFDLVYYGTITMSDKNNNYRFAYNAPRNISTSQSPTYTYYMWSGDTKDMPTNPATETYSIAKNSDDFVSEGFLAHLNNYRYMSYYYLGYDEHPRDSQATGYQDIGEWYIDVTISPYPILRRATVNTSTEDTTYNGTLLTQFGTVTKTKTCVNQSYYYGCLRYEYHASVNATATKNLKIYDTKVEANDFTNKKIILPYNSEIGMTHSNENGYKMTMIGWRLAYVLDSDGTEYFDNTDAFNLAYNYAIRSGYGSISKDIGLVFAEGGYYLVPDKVTKVVFEPVWAYTIYVGDAFNDEMFNALNGNSNYTLADWNSYYNSGLTGNDDNNNGKTPQTAVATLQKAYELAAQTPKHDNLYSTVIMLVDNLHYSPSQDSPRDLYCDFANTNNSVQVTIRSLDENGDNKPDYTLYMRNLHNMNISSVRFDFVNLLGIPQVGITNGKLNQFILQQNTDFEVTETVNTDLIDLNVGPANSVRVNGGYYNIFAGVNTQGNNSVSIKYILFGGKAYADLLTSGYVERNGWANVATINVLGGRVKTLSSNYGYGGYNAINTYINVDGGYIDNFHGVYGSGSNRPVYININGSYINEFYAGGKLEASEMIDGVIVNVDNSRIGLYFGASEFGTIKNGAKNTINNSVIDQLYGAGYGGTTYFQYEGSISKDTSCSSTRYTTGTSGYSPGRSQQFNIVAGQDVYGNQIQKINVYFDGYYTAELISQNGCAISYFTKYYTYLSAATVDSVELYVNNSTINGDVYGGGNKGKVTTALTMVLTDTIVKGNVYGGGYSSSVETAKVFKNNDGYVAPEFISYAIDNKAKYPQYTTVRWIPFEDGEAWRNWGLTDWNNNTFKSEMYKGFGEVQSTNAYIELAGSGTTVYGNVYGGGNLATVNLDDGNGTLNLLINDGVKIRGSVFGGGNNAAVNGNIDLRIVNNGDSQTVINNVFAASNNGTVSGNAEVTINGHPKITNLYSGGNNSSVSETKAYIEGGEIENVYGGSNTNGDVGTSNVLVGELNSTGTLASFKKPTVDICQTGGLSYDVWVNNVDPTNWNNDNYTIKLYNATTNVTFVKYQFKLKAYLIGEFAHNRSNANIQIADHAIIIDERDRYNLQNSYPLEPGRVNTYSFAALWPEGFNYQMSQRDPDLYNYYWRYVEQYVIAYDADGNEYYLEGCKPEVRDQYGRQVSSSTTRVRQTVTIDKTAFNLPRIDEKISDITLGNVYGGNNIGGKTDSVNIMINGKNPGSTVEIGNIYGGGSKTVTGTNNSTNVRVAVNGGHITGSVFGSSFGDVNDTTMETPATMYSTPYVLITGNATIDGSVFGGGYAKDANVGDADVPTSTYVYIDSGTIGENVYGGGYGDIIYGSSHVYVGLQNTVTTQVRNIFGVGNNNSPFKNVTLAGNNSNATVNIHGTVFGGSETGSKDAESYDYKTKSVMQGIDIYVTDISRKVTVTIDKSIFGSGNYSSSGGTSYIYLTDWGTRNNPKRMASIQRADNVIMSNSSILLSGATDSTNKFDKVKYSFNHIKNLKLGNSSTIYSSAQANMLQNFYSYNGNCQNTNSEGVTTNGTLSTVTKNGNTITVDDDVKQVIRSATGGNRLYLLNGKGLNILTSEEIGDSFGNVYGMTFVGVYEDNNGTLTRNYFDTNYDFDARRTVTITNTDYSGYVLGGNRITNNNNQDYTVHGFYTNTFYSTNNSSSGRVYSTIINPTPENQAYYYWNIGSPSIAMEVNLTASKYSLSGMKSLAMYQFSNALKVSFDVVDFDASALNDGVSLIEPSSIPTIASSSDVAESVFGLSIETSDSGWINEGNTNFLKTANVNNSDTYEGTVRYDTSGSENIPRFVINFENSRNIKHDIDLGTVVITLKAHMFKENEVESTTTTIKVYVNLDTAYYDTDDYESSMAPGKYYKSFLSSKTNITPNSTFSTYFNMYASGNNIYTKAEEQYPGATIDHVLYTSYVLPAGTRITMLDISDNRDPKYYYYDVTGLEGNALKPSIDNKYTGDEDTFYSYPLSWFRRMDSTSDNNLFNEAEARSRYLIADKDAEGHDVTSTVEQFVFIVDFKDVTTHSSTLPITNEEFYLALRATEAENQYVFSTPISETMEKMNFSLYDATDASFGLDVTDYPTSSESIYVDDVFDFNANITVNEKSISDEQYGNIAVRNTNYFQDRLGLRIGMFNITYDNEGNEIASQVVGDELAGAVFYIGETGYAPASNGLVRLKLADYVVNINKTITVDLRNSNIRSGLYEFRVTAFASADGLFAKQGDTITNSTDTFRLNLVNEKYGLNSEIAEESDTIIYKNGKTTGGEDTVDIDLSYFGSYVDPSIKVSLMRRSYSSINSYDYEEADISKIFDLSSTAFSDNSNLTATDLFDTSTMTIKSDALVGHGDSGEMGTYRISFKLRDDIELKTGTYRIMFTLYNGNHDVGDVYTYIIIKN